MTGWRRFLDSLFKVPVLKEEDKEISAKKKARQ